MANEYRDPLAAALSRIDALERENAALKRAQSDRPATASELEAVRLENELRHLDLKHDARVRSLYGEVRPSRAALSPNVATFAGLAMLAIGLVIAFVTHAPQVAVGFTFAAALLYIALQWGSVTVRRWIREHEAKRAALLARIAELRGAPLESPRVRVADMAEAEEEVDEGVESATGDDATSKRRGRETP
jgi:Flp pilus assembly protein TadB